MKPKITLLGAGPGDPDLITVKGMKALQNADVVMYDALANEVLLEYSPSHCKHIYVGKRANDCKFTQDEINAMLISEALAHGHVVRLKGGDPYVFGRGHEELEEIKKAGIEAEIIPGISSAIAAPQSVGIPVTRRGLSDSFWVMTGHTTEGFTSNELISAVKTDATVIILMGLGRLSTIVETYKSVYKHHLPIAVIQNGTLPNQKAVVSTIENIEEDVKKAEIKTPAIIVIGSVAALANEEFYSENYKKNLQNTKNMAYSDIPNPFGTEEPSQRNTQFAIRNTNDLFPVFLKLHELRLLIVGGGYVGLEKITAVLQNSPLANITLVSPEIRPEIQQLAKEYPNIKLEFKCFQTKDLGDKDLVIVATNDKELNKDIKGWAKQVGILCNVADTPDQCDFYLGSVVKKGSLKLAISTNGQSPTMAKRIREALEDVFPDELEAVFSQLREIRKQLKGDFEEKVRKLDEITRVISEKGENTEGGKKTIES
jgi:uroporphyrin-III C-methyltransferase